MNCPKCGAASQLAELDITGIEVDHCASCKGVWLDEYELEDLLEVGTSDLNKLMEGNQSEELDEQQAKCPRDGQTLRRVRTAQSKETTVEACPECQGLWLDGGEFRRLRGKG